ncbi:MAG: tRNA threonylcarbamoyladenosine dehydratase [Bdellovibrio sp.]|nr:tRNA threonylcarbamoyladenosine dehydratase [Methylotenera sp.]
MSVDIDFARRFGGVNRLYGAAGLAKLQTAHVVVVGIGGVGSWAAEALARNAVGFITLVDLDNVAESNVNRQIHAVDGNFGKAKVSAMAERIGVINPECIVREIEDFVTLENVAKLLNFSKNAVIDCTDDVKAKIAMALNSKAMQTPLIMSGSAGGRLDPTRIAVSDMAFVQGDKLLAKVRNQLRRDHAFPKASQTKKSAKFAINCVYSDEPVLKSKTNNQVIACELDSPAITGLNCAGYGSSVCVTAPFGFAMAQMAINLIIA